MGYFYKVESKPAMIKCSMCGGSGVTSETPEYSGQDIKYYTCHYCKGTGKRKGYLMRWKQFSDSDWCNWYESDRPAD